MSPGGFENCHVAVVKACPLMLSIRNIQNNRLVADFFRGLPVVQMDEARLPLTVLLVDSKMTTTIKMLSQYKAW